MAVVWYLDASISLTTVLGKIVEVTVTVGSCFSQECSMRDLSQEILLSRRPESATANAVIIANASHLGYALGLRRIWNGVLVVKHGAMFVEIRFY